MDKSNKCKLASTKLKRRYVGRTTNGDRPAGCYWSSDSFAYFNAITSTSSTQPKNFGNRGGICSKAGMLDANITRILTVILCLKLSIKLSVRLSLQLK